MILIRLLFALNYHDSCTVDRDSCTVENLIQIILIVIHVQFNPQLTQFKFNQVLELNKEVYQLKV